MTPLATFVADQTRLVRLAAELLGADDVVAVDPDALGTPLYKVSVRGPVVPLEGVLVRDWCRDNKQTFHGMRFGARLYRAGDGESGVTFCRVHAPDASEHTLTMFVVVARADYRRLFRLATAAQNVAEPPAEPPVAPADTLSALRRNTVDYLTPTNLDRIRRYGGRPRRGLLLSGPPGNGKTSACRWVRRLCRERGLAEKSVSPDDYRCARNAKDPAAAVRELFTVEPAGVVFFDDFDAALADRSNRDSAEDQAIFLAALDGMTVNSGVAHVFTTNLPLSRIDPAFRRPGRLDVVLTFPKPDADLRRVLVARWHPDLLAGIDPAAAVADTDGLSFAEVDEFKNLLVLHFTETGVWDWAWAKEQFRVGRGDLTPTPPKLGFGAVAARNGAH